MTGSLLIEKDDNMKNFYALVKIRITALTIKLNVMPPLIYPHMISFRMTPTFGI